jgi:hypothetical protein
VIEPALRRRARRDEHRRANRRRGRRHHHQAIRCFDRERPLVDEDEEADADGQEHQPDLQ